MFYRFFNKHKFLFIFVFTTGRSGTGFLSQIFGHGKFDKMTLHRIGDAIVTHESWRKPPIEQLKKLKLDSKEAAAIVQEAMNSKLAELQSDFPGVSKYLIADHKIGRFFASSLKYTNHSFKVIRIHREEAEVLASFKRIYKERQANTEAEVFERFMRNNWARNYYAPTDASCIQKISPADWAQLDYGDKFAWYIEEVNRQWEYTKKVLPKKSFIEIEFSDLINESGPKAIEDFIGIPYSRELLSTRANRAVKTKYK